MLLCCLYRNNSENRKWCFLGSGNYSATFKEFDLESTTNVCDSFSREGSGWCREGASWIFLTRPNGSSDATQLCKDYPGCLHNLEQNPFYER